MTSTRLTRFALLSLFTAPLLLAGCGKSMLPTPDALATPASAPAGTHVTDADVTNNVTRALMQDDSIKGLQIAVVTLKGDVRLTGVAANQAQIDTALRLARGSDGVHAIHDELTLKP